MNMGSLLVKGYSRKAQKLAAYAKALGHPARIAILELLLQKKSCICGSIVAELPIAQATVSQHLKELKNAGLIKGTLEGAAICYCINEKEWAEAACILIHFLDQSPKVNNSNCCK